MSACLMVLVLVAPMASRADTAEPEIAPQWIRWGNGLKTDYLIFNALSANSTANQALVDNPLNTQSFATVTALHDALHDPWARVFMKYLVSCALAPDQKVEWTSSVPGIPPETWYGGGGLCSSWGSVAPSVLSNKDECLELVSACILARNNPAAARVRINLRGGGLANPAVLKPRARTNPDLFVPSMMLNNGTVQMAQPIPSFQPCDSATGSDCGWRSVSVGVCSANAPITFTVSSSLGSSICGALRACEGIRGCTQTEKLAERGTSCGSNSVDFLCPSSGRFSVMTAFSSQTSQPDDNSWDGQTAIGTKARLMNEGELFTRREGAFYGNIFGSSAILPGLLVKYNTTTQETILTIHGALPAEYVRQGEGWCRRVSGGRCVEAVPRIPRGTSVYMKMYSCSDPAFPGGDANLPGRVCALPNNSENCAAHLMGSCTSTKTGGTGRCLEDSVYGLYNCMGKETAAWARPVMTYVP
ncbi:hypothetical protein [Hyalangium versicolor]|uniref:hypothetical protein n=1 Tax=Hyalangium versicolor TaxID=2861190 RepID=UPI001CCCEAFF|nr:hypothetical protein [Hyalangium versicolor]